MKKLFFGLFLLIFLASPAAVVRSEVTQQQLFDAYKYAYEQYITARFDLARDVFKKIAILSNNPGLSANSLYYYSQCAFRTLDFENSVKALQILAKKYPDSTAIKKGFVKRLAVALIDQATRLQTHWDYLRYQDGEDDKGKPLFKESIPDEPGMKIKRINFKLAFGMYRVLRLTEPNAPETAAAKQKLEKMLNTPLGVLWVDEKPAIEKKWGHPPDFISLFTMDEKKYFSQAICERMFYNWKTDKLYLFLDMYDDIRNLKPRFSAKTKEAKSPAHAAAPAAGSDGVPPPPSDDMNVPPPPGTSPDTGAKATLTQSTGENEVPSLTLANLFKAAGYDPYMDSSSNVIESPPAELNM